MTVTIDEIKAVLAERFSGVVSNGKHNPNGIACALEVYSQVRGVDWTDSPASLDMPDVRRLNDARWSSDAARTEAMVPLLAAMSVWAGWADHQRVDWCRRVAKRTIQEILPIPLRACGLTDAADRCEREGTEESARAARTAADAYSAAYAAASAYSAAYAAYAAYAAAYAAAADSAAYAAAADSAAAKRDAVLNLACRIWIEEARQ